MNFEKINKFFFNKTAKNVLYTRPLTYKYDERVTIVSMVGATTVNMYLVAIKSFMEHFGYGKIEVINDGSLQPSDISILKHHVPKLNISLASDVDTHGCPTYISWKRLFRIQQLAESSYVIQLDSDTISIGPLYEIDNRVNSNEGFLIGSMRWGAPVRTEFLNSIVSSWKNTHVQPLAEENFHKMTFFADGTKYIRACAGFAGYPKKFATIEEIKALSDEIESYIGNVWHNWGSEQTATCCLISKTKNATPLPWPYYQNHLFPKSNEHIKSMNFIHFIGSNRYDNGTYKKLVHNKIQNWKSS
ncbi:MAG: hypothetical protein ACJAXJ_000030 [Colwellia sp.]|jgi:hypothetical protein